MSEMTATETVGLTKLDITALRTADDVYAVLQDGRYLLRAVKRKQYDDPDPWAADKYHEVVCRGVSRSYSQNGVTHDDGFTSGFASVWRSDGIWQILRPGDELVLEFGQGAMQTPAIDEDGWVGDAVEIEVVRNGKRMRFFAASYVGPNNTARICR